MRNIQQTIEDMPLEAVRLVLARFGYKVANSTSEHCLRATLWDEHTNGWIGDRDIGEALDDYEYDQQSGREMAEEQSS
jgi:hypothetical protein